MAQNSADESTFNIALATLVGVPNFSNLNYLLFQSNLNRSWGIDTMAQDSAD
jgi:hypothetical protein